MKYKGIIIAVVILTLVTIGLSGVGFSSRAQTGNTASGEIWRVIDERSILSTGARVIIPRAYRTVRLNKSELAQVLAQAPLEFTAAARSKQVVLRVPMPDGTLSRFRIEDSPIMEPGLAARFPNIKTYRGQGIDDPTATARFDMTPAGFHGIILSAGDTVYIDPYAKGDTTNYISSFKRDLTNNPHYECRFDDFDADAPSSPFSGDEAAPNVAPHAGTLRTYRLALAVTGEYTLYHAPDLLEADASRKQKALTALTTTLNRVNSIYERDVSVRMILVEDELEVVYTNPATDPYPNDPVGISMLVANQVNLDAPEPVGPIGEGNYDIGHVMSTGFGGVAFLESVCQRGEPDVPGDGENAGGYTGLDTPEGDGFDIDFVAHEMGHQFGGNHTFNGQTGSCSGTNREPTAAYEPGSATTIMGYAGICGAQDLQPHSDADFHVKSLEEIIAFTGGNGLTLQRDGDSCSTKTTINNTAPSVNAGADYNIPKNTPFTLTATGSDADGDTVTYDWEEYDLGPAATAGNDRDSDGQPRPIFRSYLPTTNPTRTFPKLQYILNNANTPPTTYDCGRGAAEPCLTGEVLPQITRTMNFQVTVRDNRAAGGGVNSDLALVNVNDNSGPFLVTQPNTAVTWEGNSSQTVTWDVANTTAAPVNAANVRISLSTDGGNTFPIVLTESTPNDGSEAVTVPNINTTTARVKVEAIGNIFFDISNTNFTINPGQVVCTITNVALSSVGALASASSTYINGGYPPFSANDGEHKGLNWGNNGGWNDSTRDIWPDSLDITLNSTQTISEIRVYTLQNDYRNPVEPTLLTPADFYGIEDFNVEYWDGDSWETVTGGNVTGNDKAMRIFAFAPVTTSKIRVVVTKARMNWSRITEVEAFGCAGP